MRRDQYEDDEGYVIIEKRSGSAGSFLWGLAIGAGIALLLAPQSGEETRRTIRKRARNVRDAAQDAAEQLSDSVVDRYQSTRRAVEDRIDSARQAIDLKKRQAHEAIRAGREAAEQARLELETRIAETKAAYNAGADVARKQRRTTAPAVDPDDSSPV